MFNGLPQSLALFLLAALAAEASAVPSTPPAGQTLSLQRRSAAPARTDEEWGTWAKSNKELLIAKYGGSGGSTKPTH